MILKKVYLQVQQPEARECLWIKPTSNGVNLYVIDNGQVVSLNVANGTNSSENIAQSISNELIGSVQDEKTANTINGAKKYAKDLNDTIIGTSSDTASDLTLHGLKAYIDSKTTA